MSNDDIVQGEVEFTEQDQADVAKLLGGGEEPSFHTVLEVWREVLVPAKAEAGARIEPQWANRITSSYREIDFADMVEYRDRYFGKILELATILDLEIASDDQCLDYETPEDDAAENEAHYKNLVLLWQMAFQQWELDWDCTAEHAAVELAAISEVHKMFLGQQGLVAYLDQIPFSFTEADQEQLGEALHLHRETELAKAAEEGR